VVLDRSGIVTAPVTATRIGPGADWRADNPGVRAHLRDELALHTLRAELLALVEETMQPIQASLWLPPPGPSTAVDGPALWWLAGVE
jgi:hypothetical protein